MLCTELHPKSECTSSKLLCANCALEHSSDDEKCKHIREKCFLLNKYILSILTGEHVINNRHQILKNKELHNLVDNIGFQETIISKATKSTLIEDPIINENIETLKSQIELVNENVFAVNEGYMELAGTLQNAIEENNTRLLATIQSKLDAFASTQ